MSEAWRQDPRTQTTFFVFAISVVLLIVIVVGLDAFYRRTAEQEHVRKVVIPEPRALRALEAAQRLKLGEYRWVDRERGIVAIPIERAMDLLVEEAGATGRPER